MMIVTMFLALVKVIKQLNSVSQHLLFCDIFSFFFFLVFKLTNFIIRFINLFINISLFQLKFKKENKLAIE